MYIAGQGHEHLGPGTSMVQRINWTPPQERQAEGLGCACGGKCGMGLFDSMDPSAWTWQEWAAIGIGGYLVTSLLFTGRRAARQLSEGVSARVKKHRRRLGARIAGSKV